VPGCRVGHSPSFSRGQGDRGEQTTYLPALQWRKRPEVASRGKGCRAYLARWSQRMVMSLLWQGSGVSEPEKDPFGVLLEQIRQIVREEIGAAFQNGTAHTPEKDRLLTPKEAAEILGQNTKWLYRHAARLPFARRLSRKSLRFSEKGLRRWLATRSALSPR